AEMLLKKHGPNELKEKTGEHIAVKFIRSFTSFLVLLLIAAAIVAALLGEMLDAAMIIAIVFLQGVLGFVQEYKAEKSFEALKRMISPKANVLRDGEVCVIDARCIVPGDVVLLEAGDRVPADGKLFGSYGLAADEAALTGESVPVHKGEGDGVSMGTVLVSGKGRMLAEETGMRTKMGKITEMVQTVQKEHTPLEQDLDKMGKQLGAGVLVLCAFIFLAGLFRGFGPVDMFLTSVSLAVAAIPEGLPAVVMITLAVGVQRMSRRNSIVKKLKSVETLGCADVICTDKTGTLTRNEMTVRKVLVCGRVVDVGGSGYAPKGEFSFAGRRTEPCEELNMLMRIGVLCNGSHLRRDVKKGWEIIGDPTEGSLLVLAAKGGMWKDEMEKGAPAVLEFPFDPDRKMMTVVRKGGRGNVAYAKGAPEVILRKCSGIRDGGKVRKLTNVEKGRIAKENDALTSKGYRTLALAYREVAGAGTKQAEVEKGLVFVGIAGIMDSPREEVKDALALCRSAGIRVIMITGDHPLTAKAIADELGIGNGKVITGEELDRMGQKEFEEIVEGISVYARVSPAHKLRIVDALNARGHVVAMTGDGVNDAPALKKADIGVAMGITGTEVAKESSDMVLADDNFATIVAAVEEGRGIYDNIRKTIAFLLSGNIAEVAVIFLAVMLGMPLPLIAIQILWINLVTDGLPAIALSVDPIGRDVMGRKPREKHESVWKGMGLFIVESPIIVTFAILAVFEQMLKQGDVVLAQTMAFTMMVMMEKAQVFCARSLEKPVWRELLGNKWVVYVTLLTIAMHFAIIYDPTLNVLFSVKPLSLENWAVVLGLCLFLFAYMEIRKWMGSRRKK
ncbi:MAG: cation-translocating P-type ATPase, partial [Candidatus Micrarchaeota archaeon]|nr:cation-translocating P-type ATPase [Candidatus Micrarchaeota archaeon]